MNKIPTDSVTLLGLFIAAAAYVVPACVGVPEAILVILYAALGIPIAAFFTYRGAKMK